MRAGEGTWRELNVQIYGQSSRVMRAATARHAILQCEKVDVDKYANEPQSEYQIILRMADTAPFRQHEEKFFQDSAFLQIKRRRGHSFRRRDGGAILLQNCGLNGCAWVSDPGKWWISPALRYDRIFCDSILPATRCCC